MRAVRLSRRTARWAVKNIALIMQAEALARLNVPLWRRIAVAFGWETPYRSYCKKYAAAMDRAISEAANKTIAAAVKGRDL